MYFRDRVEAGKQLALALEHLAQPNLIVLGLPRGGVPVAFEVASHLHAPLDVLLVRKLGTPDQKELAFGAVGEGGVRVLNDEIVRRVGLSDRLINEVTSRENAEIERRQITYRNGRPPLELVGRVAIVVDDGLATGATARAACTVARRLGAERVVLAVPVAPEGWESGFTDVTDERLSLFSTADFGSVGYFYDNFEPIGDDTVRALLSYAVRHEIDDEVVVPLSGRRSVTAHVRAPLGAIGTVVFAHGSGSGRKSPRNVRVADEMHRAGYATVLADLLFDDEDRDQAFDIAVLAQRLSAVTKWVKGHPVLGRNKIALYGASTGAAAALAVASEDHDIRCVISRGGRVDLAGEFLDGLSQPVLLIVGSRDTIVRALNEKTRQQIGEKQCSLVVVDGASHLFEEQGALDQVARQSVSFLASHLL
jgi:predicted phosphoribosyltransferase/dienelactone hydrolase